MNILFPSGVTENELCVLEFLLPKGCYVSEGRIYLPDKTPAEAAILLDNITILCWDNKKIDIKKMRAELSKGIRIVSESA